MLMNTNGRLESFLVKSIRILLTINQGVIYGGDEKHVELMNKAYALFSLSNPLHPDVFLSTRKFEAEVDSSSSYVQFCYNKSKGGSYDFEYDEWR